MQRRVPWRRSSPPWRPRARRPCPPPPPRATPHRRRRRRRRRTARKMRCPWTRPSAALGWSSGPSATWAWLARRCCHRPCTGQSACSASSAPRLGPSRSPSSCPRRRRACFTRWSSVRFLRIWPRGMSAPSPPTLTTAPASATCSSSGCPPQSRAWACACTAPPRSGWTARRTSGACWPHAGSPAVSPSSSRAWPRSPLRRLSACRRRSPSPCCTDP
mmetsp:Transcript_30482/g.87373  ORF Transcript_30482/g.87373 Transcript_30482/m.87373 type:complete len:217 (+) Transcript_30482:533-1183(+)